VASVYGPTECTTFATYHPLRRLAPEEPALPIGRPIQTPASTGRRRPAVRARLCAAGETGAVCLAGSGLSPRISRDVRGRPRPVHRLIGGRRKRLYLTGDQGQLRADGDVVSLDHLDDQVKISGYRI
jgi:non-ribosomal peptide synthetase component F